MIYNQLSDFSVDDKVKVFDKLYSSAKEELDHVIKYKRSIKDITQYMYEDVLRSMFGSSIFDKINKITQ